MNETIILIVVAAAVIIYLVFGMKLLCSKLYLSEGTALLTLGLILAVVVCVVFCAPQSCDAAVLSSRQPTSSLNDEAVVEEEGEAVERHELIPSPVTGEYLERKVYGDKGGGNDIYYYYYLADDGTTVVQEDLWWPWTTIRVGEEGSKAEYVEYVRHERFLWGLISVNKPHYVVTIPPKD